MPLRQVGSYRDGATSRLIPVMAETSVVGASVAVQLGTTYWPATRGDWPVRGGEYGPGQKAAFPQSEADALVAAGIASYV